MVDKQNVFVNIFLGIITTGFDGWAFQGVFWRLEDRVEYPQRTRFTRNGGNQDGNVKYCSEGKQKKKKQGRRAGRVGVVSLEISKTQEQLLVSGVEKDKIMQYLSSCQSPVDRTQKPG